MIYLYKIKYEFEGKKMLSMINLYIIVNFKIHFNYDIDVVSRIVIFFL